MRTLIDNGNAPAKRQPLIGHYGHLRKAYLEQFDPGLYTALLASEKLYEHCAEINEACRSRIDLIMPQLAGSAGATESRRPYEMGRLDERLQGASGGNRQVGAYLHLTVKSRKK